MASPSKAFIDPVGVTPGMQPLPNVEGGMVHRGMVPAHSAPTTFFPWGMTLPASTRAPISITTYAQIPTPPMGRQMMLTFPAIYKERDAVSAVTTGQLYPPPAP